MRTGLWRPGRRVARIGRPLGGPVLAAAWILATTGCGGAPGAPPRPTTQTGQVGRSPAGMVVSGAPLATRVGVQILEAGGNAVDAAVAAAFALAVVEPTMSGLGGRTQVLIRTPAGEVAGFDGTTEVPAGYRAGEVAEDEDAYGYATIGIPGTVAALAAALEAHGSLSLAEVVAPAIELAERGFPLPAEEAQRIAGVADRLREFEGSRRYFLKPDGSAYRAGEHFVQADLARTLRAIAEGGADAFYRGEIAEAMSADILAHGGFLRSADLAGYRALPARVVKGSYRGYDLVGTYLPASGATTIQALQMMERFDLSRIVGTPEWVAIVAQALLIAFEDRVADLGPPAEHAATLVSEEWAAQRARRIRTADHAEPVGAAAAAAGTYEPAHTTHLSVADSRGGLVALTQSIGPMMGSKVAAPGLGFVYAATMGYLGALEPGDRPFSSQSPLIASAPDGSTYVVGAAGGRRIISAIVAAMSRAIDQELPFDEALAAPRFHPVPRRIDMEVRPGAAWSAAALAELRSLGFEVRARDEPPYFGRIHGIFYDARQGEFIGVADPRWNGSAAGPACFRVRGSPSPTPACRRASPAS